MNDDYFDAIEELHSGDTVNLNGIIDEASKRDKIKSNAFSNFFSKLFKNKKDERIMEYTFSKNDASQMNDTSSKKNPDITCRVLFVSVLDKILLLLLFIMFVISTLNNFSGNISSLGYNFWFKFIHEILIIVIYALIYFLFNWVYRCATKTVLCVTNEQIYKESYFLFRKSETTIPINRVSSVSTLNLFWIFRSVIVFSYNKLPLIYFTWNNQQFKDRVEELLTGEKRKIRNKYDNRNLITPKQYSNMKYLLIVFVVIIAILGLVRMIFFFTSEERKMVGEYKYGDYYIELKNNGKCSMNLTFDDVKDCNWSYDKEKNNIDLVMEVVGYREDYINSFVAKKYTFNRTISVSYKKNKLEYNSYTFNKE